jgi:hypothetical protein
MVQGWESRIDLANKRREAARQRKQARKLPKPISGDVVLSALLNGGLVNLDAAVIEAWLEIEGGKLLCYSHFRAESCHCKRCKFSHEYTISRMTNVNVMDDGVKDRFEVCMERTSNISSIPTANFSKLKFLCVDGECVYDHDNIQRWRDWVGGVKSRRKISTIHEDSSDESNNEKDSKVETNTIVSEKIHSDIQLEMVALSLVGTPTPPTVFPLLDVSSIILSNIAQYVSDNDLIQLYSTSTLMKRFMLSCTDLYERRRDYLNSFQLSGRDLSKMRKQEKKKKIKNANAKVTTKKDGHKKVKVCRH